MRLLRSPSIDQVINVLRLTCQRHWEESVSSLGGHWHQLRCHFQSFSISMATTRSHDQQFFWFVAFFLRLEWIDMLHPRSLKLPNEYWGLLACNIRCQHCRRRWQVMAALSSHVICSSYGDNHSHSDMPTNLLKHGLLPTLENARWSLDSTDVLAHLVEDLQGVRNSRMQVLFEMRKSGIQVLGFVLYEASQDSFPSSDRKLPFVCNISIDSLGQ